MSVTHGLRKNVMSARETARERGRWSAGLLMAVLAGAYLTFGHAITHGAEPNAPSAAVGCIIG